MHLTISNIQSIPSAPTRSPHLPPLSVQLLSAPQAAELHQVPTPRQPATSLKNNRF